MITKCFYTFSGCVVSNVTWATHQNYTYFDNSGLVLTNFQYIIYTKINAVNSSNTIFFARSLIYGLKNTSWGRKLSFNCYLDATWPTLGQYWGGSLTNPMLIPTFFLHIWPKGQWEPRSKVGSLSLPECLVGFELGTFWFWLQHLNPLAHSPTH